jgi:hypothetical protein
MQARASNKTLTVAFWATTAFFSVWMLFTAYAELYLPEVEKVFPHLGFPARFFRVELSVAKVLGVLVLLLPAPPRLKEWAYAGFAINLVSALIAHLAAGDDASKYAWPMAAAAVMALSYYAHLKLTAKS